ncbi:MAG: hypothetical protein LBD70_01650, partial [Bifidobacteriaceae bacterium]|nr:hypothetical protein [Bifidobacteriaceae bacterium]
MARFTRQRRTWAVALAALVSAGIVGVGGCADTGGSEPDPGVTGKVTSGEIVWWGFTPGSPVNEEYIAAFNED